MRNLYNCYALIKIQMNNKLTANERLKALEREADYTTNGHASIALSVATENTVATFATTSSGGTKAYEFPGNSNIYRDSYKSTSTTDQNAALNHYEQVGGKYIEGAKPMEADLARKKNAEVALAATLVFNDKVEQEKLQVKISKGERQLKVIGGLIMVIFFAAVVFFALALV